MRVSAGYNGNLRLKYWELLHCFKRLSCFASCWKIAQARIEKPDVDTQTIFPPLRGFFLILPTPSETVFLCLKGDLLPWSKEDKLERTWIQTVTLS
jgi:hypothetical protein